MRNFFMRPLAKLALLIALGGCQQPVGYHSPDGYDREASRRPQAPDEMIRTDADTYAPGATVSMRLTNTTGRTLSYNLCRSHIERRAGEGWAVVQQSLNEVCTAELRGLRPGQSATFTFRLPPTARTGPYRIRTQLSDARGGQPVEAVSNPFQSGRERND